MYHIDRLVIVDSFHDRWSRYGHLILLALTYPLIPFIELEVQFLLYLSQMLEYLLHLLEQVGGHGYLILLLPLAHLRYGNT